MKSEMMDMSKVLLVVHLLLLIIHVKSSTDGELYANCNEYDVTVITDTTGTLAEPQNQSFYDYGSEVFCNWEIRNISNKDVLFFNLSSLDIAGTSGSDCSGDRLTISDCSVEYGQTWLRDCGQVTTPNYTQGTTNDGCVYFLTTRTSAAETELSLSWWYAPICSGGIYYHSNKDPEFFDSATWPWYDGTPDCQYKITAPSDYVRISIKHFSTSGSDCDGDYLEIANAYNPSEIWYKFCETIEDRHLYGAGISALITHHRTDELGSFQLSWEVSTTKGYTQKQRENLIIWCSVAGGAFVLLLMVLIVSLRYCQCSPCYHKKTENRYPQKQESWKMSAVSPSSVSAYPSQPETTPQPKPKAQQPPKPKLPHIMISYQWDVKKEVLMFRQELDKAGYRVWIDVEQMHKNTSTFDAMTDAIEYAAVVVPALTAKYQESVNCRKEIEFADKSKKPIVAVRFEKKFKPTKWLSFLLGNNLWHDLSEPSIYLEQLENFLDDIAAIGASAKKESETERDPEEESDEA